MQRSQNILKETRFATTFFLICLLSRGILSTFAKEITLKNIDMKKFTGKCGVACATVLVIAGLASCNGKSGATDTDAKDSVEVCESDTLVSNTFTLKSTENCKEEGFLGDYLIGLEASIEAPSFDQNPVLARAIMEWVIENLGSSYQGDLKDTDALMKQLQAEVDEMEYKQIEVKKVYETPKVVTYILNTYVNPVGAAHGGATAMGATFRKSDGKVFGSNMILDKDGESPLQALLKDGLKKYFEVSSDDSLAEMLMMDSSYSVDYLPKPATAPWVTDKGIVFCYQQYEIACYAAGMPTVVIPLKDAGSLLTPFAKEVLDVK